MPIFAASCPSWLVLTRSQANVKLLWEYYGETIDLAVEPERILDAMRRSGFVDVECSVTFGIFREYLGRKP